MEPKNGSCTPPKDLPEGDKAAAQARPLNGETALGDGELKQLQDELAKSKGEAADFYDKYLRALAELENIKRRSEREKSDLRKFGLENFIRDLLPVLDSFDKALGNHGETNAGELSPEWGSFVAGMRLVSKQLTEILERHGLTAVAAVGEKFDPNMHQAIQRFESAEASDEVVKDEYSKGYTLHGRLIRPAMVSVMVPSVPK